MPKTTTSNWINRNWIWFVPLLVLVAVLVVGSFLAFVLTVLKSSDAYTGAVARAQASPAVIAALGSPVKDGILFSGNITENNSSGNADLAIPLSGPKGKAELYVSATRSDGQWHFDRLIVEIAITHQRLDLTDTNQLPAKTPDSGASPAGK
jgi:hypothetical protein